MNSDNKPIPVNRHSFEGMERAAIDWFPEPSSVYFINYRYGDVQKPYVYCRDKQEIKTAGLRVSERVHFYFNNNQFYCHTSIHHKGVCSRKNDDDGGTCSLATSQINGVLFPEQLVINTQNVDATRQVVLARFNRSTQKQHVVCEKLQSLHVDVLDTALPLDLIEKYFTSYKPKTAEMDGMLHFWIRTIATRRKDTEELMDVCREIVAQDGTILGQACYDVENKVIYRYVRVDNTPFHGWQFIGTNTSPFPNTLDNWPRKERVGLCFDMNQHDKVSVMNAWREIDSVYLDSGSATKSYGYLKYRYSRYIEPCRLDIHLWMVDTELQCKTMLEKPSIVDQNIKPCLSDSNEKNEKLSDVTCTRVHAVPQPDPTPTLSDDPFDISNYPVFNGVARPLHDHIVLQQIPVTKNPKIVVSSIEFRAFVFVESGEDCPQTSTYDLHSERIGTNVKGLLSVLKSCRDGYYFDEESPFSVVDIYGMVCQT